MQTHAAATLAVRTLPGVQGGQGGAHGQTVHGPRRHHRAEEAVQPPQTHPRHDRGGEKHGDKNGAAGFETCAEFFAPGMYDVQGARRRARGGKGRLCDGWEFHSGKFAVLARLLAILRAETKDRVVIISNYTQTLDLVQLLCRQNNYPAVRLDGTTSISKRQKLVKQFNDPTQNQFVFPPPRKPAGAGSTSSAGTGLCCSTRLEPRQRQAGGGAVLALTGRRKKCYLYRLFAAGSIEEKVFQRQLSEESLQNVVNGERTLEQSAMSKEELRRLFAPTRGRAGHARRPRVREVPRGSVSRDTSPGARTRGVGGTGRGGGREQARDVGAPPQDGQPPGPRHAKSRGDDVSFVFSLQVEGCAVLAKNDDDEKNAKDAKTEATNRQPNQFPNAGTLGTSGIRPGTSGVRPGVPPAGALAAPRRLPASNPTTTTRKDEIGGGSGRRERRRWRRSRRRTKSPSS